MAHKHRTQKQKQSQRQVVTVNITQAKAEKKRRRRARRKATEADIAALEYLQPRQMPTVILQSGGFNLPQPQQIQGMPSIGMLPISQMPSPSPVLARDNWQDVGVGREGFVDILELPSKRETLDRLTLPVEPERSIPLSPIPKIDREPFPMPRQPSLEGIIEPTARAGIPSFPSQGEFNPAATKKPFREAAMEDMPVIFRTPAPNLENQMLPSGAMDIPLSDKPFMMPQMSILEDIREKYNPTKPARSTEPTKSKSKMYYEANREAILMKRRERYAKTKQQELQFNKPLMTEPAPKKKVVKKAEPFY